jgi:hypothetical protein
MSKNKPHFLTTTAHGYVAAVMFYATNVGTATQIEDLFPNKSVATKKDMCERLQDNFWDFWHEVLTEMDQRRYVSNALMAGSHLKTGHERAERAYREAMVDAMLTGLESFTGEDLNA